jgi:hypothetical protein
MRSILSPAVAMVDKEPWCCARKGSPKRISPIPTDDRTRKDDNATSVGGVHRNAQAAALDKDIATGQRPLRYTCSTITPPICTLVCAKALSFIQAALHHGRIGCRSDVRVWKGKPRDPREENVMEWWQDGSANSRRNYAIAAVCPLTPTRSSTMQPTN